MKLAGLMAAIAAKKSDQYIAETLGELRGLPQKIGQILSLKETATDREGAWTNLALSSDVGIDFSSIQEILRKEWGHLGGEQVQRVLDTMSAEPIAIASLSQVHRAVFDQNEIAVKIQFPGLLECVEDDLQALGWIDVPTARVKAFKLDGYREQLLTTLKQELDFQNEAHNIERFHDEYRDFDGLEIPMPVAKLCTPRVLVTVLRQGLSVAEAKSDWENLGKSFLFTYSHEAILLVTRFFLTGLLIKSVFHADPHPGNFRFFLRDRRLSEYGGGVSAKEINKVCLLAYDFGCVKSIQPKERQALVSLLRGLLREDERHDYLNDLRELGFDSLQLAPLRSQLFEALKILLEPLLSAEPYDYEKWNRSERLNHLLRENKWALRTSGPASFIFVIRVFQGLLYYLKNFEVKTALRPLLIEVLQNVPEDPSLVRANDLQKNEDTLRVEAKNFVVEVFENGETKAKIIMPAQSAQDFSSLIPDDVLAVIHEKQIDLLAIQKQLNSSTFKPQVVFEMSFADAKRIKLSLV